MKAVRPLEGASGGWAPPVGGASAGIRTAPAPDSILSHITHLLVSEDSQEQVLDAVADGLGGLVPYDTLTLYQADPPLRLLHPVLVRDRYQEEILAMGPIAYGVGITGAAAGSGLPQMVDDTRYDPRARLVDGTPLDPEAMIAVPLLARGELKGVLALYREGEGNHFSEDEFALAVAFGELAALAIDNAHIRAGLEMGVITDGLTAMYNHRYFHERLAEELRRSNRGKTTVGLVLYDIDDFKRINDTFGHLVGDQVLQGLASLARETCRADDVLCRIGGEEFAIILPGATAEDAQRVAERLRQIIEETSFPVVDRVTVSLGYAEGPKHAASPRELASCADLALLEAKDTGKNRACAFVPGKTEVRATGGPMGPTLRSVPSGGVGARVTSLAARGELRSVAQLRMLQSLSAKLNRLNDVRQIGEVITGELRSLIDYHNCRVHLVNEERRMLIPVAFRGELSEYQGETFEALLTAFGEGVTGRVAQTGVSYYTPNSADDPHAVTIPGTPDVDESLLVVPMRYGNRVTGTVALSKLGIDQFDEEDMRLLEALASNAAIAIENARLLEKEREAADTARQLLALSQTLTRVRESDEVMDAALEAVPSMLACAEHSAWLRDNATGEVRLVRQIGGDPALEERLASFALPSEVAERLVFSVDEPFVLSKEAASSIPSEYLVIEPLRDVLVAPMRWEPDGLGFLVLVAPTTESSFNARDLRLVRGIADITSLALGNARRFVELEQAYLSTVEALANAVEAKDAYTSDHCRALAEMAMAVGTEMGLSQERLKVVQLGALFHDIGKIGVASEIIRKPAGLTAAERREMNLHPEIGEQILAPVPFLQPVRPIVRSSHERWDGQGYPDGLKGEEIPLEARIVFVCDAFHAMTTDRPYRAALAEREAIRRLKLSSGTQFDPGIVKVFVRLHTQGKIHFH